MELSRLQSEALAGKGDKDDLESALKLAQKCGP